MPQLPGERAEFIDGLRAFVPMSMSILPFGLVCGAAASNAGLTTGQSLAMSWVIFAGSAQIASTQLFAGGAPLLVILATATIINLRFLMYGASLSQHFGGLSRRWQAAIAYLLTDQAFALTVVRRSARPEQPHLHWFYLGLAAATWVCWQLATIAGILLGSLVPPSWSLDFIVPLTFIAMLVPLLSTRAMLLAATTGGSAAVLLVLPLQLNLIAAALLGVVAGMAAEKLGGGR
ncbi:MAG: Inner membrane protein YgaZ [Candidatus Accumulibacter sp. BA-94]|uniref:AzlC family ABC transporter permease n=1 Tax=Accumulibacter sp. TaxID=2053492 RepID=UPI000447DDE3|nr:AzlC family ABC transporter permease [Accumulibacter sp.]EXI91916.1 MAG: Inner membrane protein YgaZ [Candidatus Accumulibacter sp. BA-94]HRD91352.1 AzlC family ABC transporter permease [Accumulibacter sp.]